MDTIQLQPARQKVNHFAHQKVSVYIREKKVSDTGKDYWGFSAVKLGQGRKPTGAFYLRHVNEQGKQEWVAAGQTFNEATKLREKLLAAKRAGRQGLTVEQSEDLENLGRVSVKDAVTAYLKSKEHKAKKTLAAYTNALNCFVECLPSRTRFVDELTEASVRHYVDSMTAAGLKPKTVKNRVLVVSFLLKKAGSKVKTKWHELPTIEKQRVRAFSQDELKKVFTAMSDEEHAVFSFFLGTGCREQEVSHAEWSDVDFQHRIYTVSAKPEWGFAPKSHEARDIPLPEELVSMLRERKKKAGDCKLIFPNRDKKPNGHFLRLLKRVALRAGLNCGHCVAKVNGTKKLSCKGYPVCEKWYLHRFRKTFATKLHHAGMPLKDLQKILGHKSLVTTELYLEGSDLKAAHMRGFADKAFSF